jgi:hypothetical protein
MIYHPFDHLKAGLYKDHGVSFGPEGNFEVRSIMLNMSDIAMHLRVTSQSVNECFDATLVGGCFVEFSSDYTIAIQPSTHKQNGFVLFFTVHKEVKPGRGGRRPAASAVTGTELAILQSKTNSGVQDMFAEFKESITESLNTMVTERLDTLEARSQEKEALTQAFLEQEHALLETQHANEELRAQLKEAQEHSGKLKNPSKEMRSIEQCLEKQMELMQQQMEISQKNSKLEASLLKKLLKSTERDWKRKEREDDDKKEDVPKGIFSFCCCFLDAW